jgi:hypothetical protein
MGIQPSRDVPSLRNLFDPPNPPYTPHPPSEDKLGVRRTLVAAIDPQGRIKLPKASRGAGW